MREYLRKRGLSWHDDPSNDEPATKRGWIRNGLLPLIYAHIFSLELVSQVFARQVEQGKGPQGVIAAEPAA